MAETINGLYKAEVIHRRGPRRSFEALEYATLEWLDWFNNRSLLATIGNILSAEAEARYYAMLDDHNLMKLASGNPGAGQARAGPMSATWRSVRAGHAGKMGMRTAVSLYQFEHQGVPFAVSLRTTGRLLVGVALLGLAKPANCEQNNADE